MKKLILIILLATPFQIFSQKIHGNVSSKVGASILIHNIDFSDSGLWDLYQYSKDLFAKHGVDYTWQEFENDHQLKKSFLQPRFEFSATITRDNLPFFIEGSFGSSPSSFQKTRIAIAGGLNFKYPVDSSNLFKLMIGYKFVKDYGFGNPTLVNSIGDRQIQGDIETWFNPHEPLGQNTGKLLIIVIHFERKINDSIFIGTSGNSEWDLTSKINRKSRMTNFEIGIFAKVNVF